MVQLVRQERISDCLTEQPVDVVNVIPRERVRQHTGQEIVDIPVVQACKRLNVTRKNRTLLFLSKLVKSMANKKGQSADVAGTMADGERIYETVKMPMVKQARGPGVQVAQKTVRDNERESCQGEV